MTYCFHLIEPPEWRSYDQFGQYTVTRRVSLYVVRNVVELIEFRILQFRWKMRRCRSSCDERRPETPSKLLLSGLSKSFRPRRQMSQLGNLWWSQAVVSGIQFKSKVVYKKMQFGFSEKFFSVQNSSRFPTITTRHFFLQLHQRIYTTEAYFSSSIISLPYYCLSFAFWLAS